MEMQAGRPISSDVVNPFPRPNPSLSLRLCRPWLVARTLLEPPVPGWGGALPYALIPLLLNICLATRVPIYFQLR